MQMQLESSRLILRPWQESDRLSFYQLNADPAVMRYFPKCLSRAESDQLIDKFQALITAQGWGVLGGRIEIGTALDRHDRIASSARSILLFPVY